MRMKNSEDKPVAAPGRKDPRRILGDRGENVAERHIRKAGMAILAKGFRHRGGEIDLIAQDGIEVVFVEVKTRSSDGFGNVEDSVTWHKRRKLIRTAAYYLQTRRALQQPCRFDVISIRVDDEGNPALEHLRDAFRADD